MEPEPTVPKKSKPEPVTLVLKTLEPPLEPPEGSGYPLIVLNSNYFKTKIMKFFIIVYLENS